jgi:hypothetical protein
LILLFRFEWSASLADVRRQKLSLSIKNNSPLFAKEQTYMGEVSRKIKVFCF